MTGDRSDQPDPAVPQWIHEVSRIRRRTHALRQGFWLPMVVFGLIVTASAALYARPSPSLWPPGTIIRHVNPATFPPAQAGHAAMRLPGGRWVEEPYCTVVNHVVDVPCWTGGVIPAHFNYYDSQNYTADPTAVSVYWLIALPLGFLISGCWYWLRRRRRGISTSALPFVVVGLSFVVLGVLASPGTQQTLHIGLIHSIVLPAVGSGLSNRGAGPLTVIGLGMLVLSYLERSWKLAVFSVGYIGLALVANLYDLGNLTARLGWYVGIHETQLAVALAGLYLLSGGFAFGLLQRRST